MRNILLSRDGFNQAVFARDKHKCIFCDDTKVVAHHIIERKLWEDGGYYLNNGASVCDKHHMDCELTLISVEKVREAAGITQILVPDTMYDDTVYDKWGNPFLGNGMRTRGPMFFTEQVQKVLTIANLMGDFTHHVKPARVLHLPFSPGVHNDDRMMRNCDTFVGRECIATVKKDGENTSMYPDYFHARSVDGRSHPSRDWAKGFWGQFKHDIPPEWRITGENVYAQHSIAYEDLSTYFFGFGVWNERNRRLDWDDMMQWMELLGITPVPVLDRFIWDEDHVRDLAASLDTTKVEGLVITTVDGFDYGEFHKYNAKWVRKDHVQTNKHWMHQEPIPNKLKGR
jgi:hypothetical protein